MGRASAWGSSYLTIADRQVLALFFGFGSDVEAFTEFMHRQQEKADKKAVRYRHEY